MDLLPIQSLKVGKGICLLFLPVILLANQSHAQSFFTPKDTFDRTRFIQVAAAGTIIYGATVWGLNEAWYKGHGRTSFHFFNDRGEWNNMDKAGHFFTSYFESEISFRGSKWTGMKEKNAVWLASGLGLLYQGTVEMFDAYSDRWGFSIADMLYNIAGVSLFTSQQLIWQDQRIRMKVSSWPKNYSSSPIPGTNPNSTSSLRQRTDQLFGMNFFEKYLKDYNAQTIWISVNPYSFVTGSKIPGWLNIAIGYGSENLFGGYTNSWTESGGSYWLPADQYPRYRQWYLSPDIDFRKIPTGSPFLKTVFNVLNIFKVPAPALEYRSGGIVKWHWMFL